MDSKEEIKNQIKEKYLKVKELLRAKDPDNEPYKSAYEAKELLLEMEKLLPEESDLESKDISRLAGIQYLLGTTCMGTEEITTAEKYLLKCYYSIEDIACHPDNVLCAVGCLNQIGLLYARLFRNEDALLYLDKAVNIYKTYTSAAEQEEPLSFITLYADLPPKLEKNGKILLEKTHTLSLYYIAQVYTALEERGKGALYCYETLKRQITYNDFEHVEWAVNAATMSQILIERNAFREARHHLAAAELILDQYEENLNNDESLKENELLEAKKEELCRRRSDILRCWIKYCIVLMSFSKERLMNDEDTPSQDLHPPKELVGLCFPTLSDSLINETVVTCDPLLTYEDARLVFIFGQKCCNKATEYYTLTEHASDYANISMDYSQLYVGLAFFEDSDDRKCKMLKRRLDILTNVIKNLNPTYYTDICREIWMTLGQICNDMVEMKTTKMRLSGEVTDHVSTKINSLINDGVNYYTSFIKSFIDRRTNKMPKDYPKEHEQSIILANLFAARLYSKCVGYDKVKTAEFDKKCLENYQSIVNYARSHPNIAEEMPAEVQIAEDMLLLLPYKLSRLAEIQ